MQVLGHCPCISSHSYHLLILFSLPHLPWCRALDKLVVRSCQEFRRLSFGPEGYLPCSQEPATEALCNVT